MYWKKLNLNNGLNIKSSRIYVLLSISLPIFISSITSILLGISDTIMVGRTDVIQLAAVSGGAAIYAVFSTLIVAALISNKILATKSMGEKKPEKVIQSFSHTLILGILTAFFSTLIIIVGINLFPNVLFGNKQVSHYATFYILCRIPELFLIVPLILLRDTMNAQIKTKWAMYSSIIVNISNIILGLPLIFGLWIIPELGAIGAGLSSSMATVIGLIFMIVIFRKVSDIKLSQLKFFKLSIQKLKEVSKLSYPSMISASADYIANLLIFILLGYIGEHYLAAGRIAFNIDMLLLALAGSLGVGGRILIGRNWGEKNFPEIYQLYKANLILLMIIVSGIGSLLIIFPDNIASIFTNIESVSETAHYAIQIIGLTSPFIALDTTSTGVLRALGKTKYDMNANLISIWIIQIPTALLFTFVFELGLTGVYISFSLYWISRCIISNYYALKSLKTINAEETLEG